MCRALLSVMDEHNVDSFISLSSPQMGQYGGEWAPEKAPGLGPQSSAVTWHCSLARHRLLEVAVPDLHAVQPLQDLLQPLGPGILHLQLLARCVGVCTGSSMERARGGQGLLPPSTLASPWRQ